VATVSGAPAALQGLESLELPPVDIGGQQSSVDETLDPILPAGVTLSTPQHVRLHVCIDRSQVVASPAPSPSPSPSPSPPAATPSP
jgi:YbbR domain-containing protein